MTGWSGLERELDAWAGAGAAATFWWRDDDASAPGDALDRLLRMTGEMPLALAVIPAAAIPALGERLRATGVAVLQHGYAHANHAAAGEKKNELGPHRPIDMVLSELDTGRRHLASLFGERALPILVPPWNRIGSSVRGRLAGIGFAGLSQYKARASPRVDGLSLVNTHVDIIDWRRRSFAGEDAALALAVGHLSARRSRAADAGEPTGLLTHHGAHDAPAWDFLARFIDRLARHGAAQWLTAAAVFGLASDRAPPLRNGP